MTKFHCKVDTDDYLTVDFTNSELFYFEIFQEVDGVFEDNAVGLSKEQVRMLINELEDMLED